MRKGVTALVVFAVMVVSFGCGRAALTPAKPTENLLETIQEAGLVRLLDLVKFADMTTTLEQSGPYTLFAPTNAAFAKLPADVAAELKDPKDIAAIKQLCAYHMIDGELTEEKLEAMSQATTLEGAAVSIRSQDGHLMINDIPVEGAGIAASNGIVYLLEGILIPPDSIFSARGVR